MTHRRQDIDKHIAVSSAGPESPSRRLFLRRMAASGAGIAFGGTLLAACNDGDSGTSGGSPSPSPTGAGGSGTSVDEVRVGVLLPMTGAAAAFGESGFAAIEMVFDEVNRNGGVQNLGGARIVPVLADTQSVPEVAASETERLASTDVLAVMGTIQSAATVIATPVAERAGLPWLCTSDVSAEITGRGLRYVFQPVQYTSDQAADLVAWLDGISERTVMPEKIWVMSEDAAVAQEAGNALLESGREAGLPFVEFVTYPAAEPDVGALQERARRENVDLIVQHSYTAPNAIAVTRQFQEVGFDPLGIVSLVGGHGSAAFISELGDAAEGVVNGTLFTPEINLDAAAEANEMYREKTGSPLDLVSATNLTAAGVMWDALERTGAPERDALRDALAATDISVGERFYVIPDGCRFDENGHNTRNQTLISQVQGGVHKVIAPEEFAVAEAIWPVNERG